MVPVSWRSGRRRRTATELEGAAEAAAVLARGKAEAEALQKRAEAYKEFNQAAVFDRLLETLPEIAKQLAAPMANIDTLTVVSTDGASALPKAVAGNFLQLQELIKSTTGLDLTQIVHQLTDSVDACVVPTDRSRTNGITDLRRSDAYARPMTRAHPEQRRALGRPRRAGDGVRPRVRVRPEHVAVRRARVRGDPPGGPVRPRRRGRLRPERLRPAAVRLARRVRGRRRADPRRARPGPGGVRRATR